MNSIQNYALKFCPKICLLYFKDQLALGGDTSQCLNQVDGSSAQGSLFIDPAIGAVDETDSITTGTYTSSTLALLY